MEEQNSEIIDVKRVLKQYTSNWYWFLISVVCCCALGYLFSKIQKPQYEVKANIILSEQDPLSSAVASGGLSGVSSLLGGNSDGEDEVEILKSHSVLKSVVRTLGLNIKHYDKKGPMMLTLEYPKYPIEIVPSPEILIDTLSVGIQFDVKVGHDGKANIKVKAKGKKIYSATDKSLPCIIDIPYGKFTVEATPNFIKGKKYNNKIFLCNYDVAAESLREEVNAALATKRSQIISMQMITDNQTYAADVLNTLIEKYNERGLQDHIAQTSVTADFLKDRLVMMRQELDSTEASLAKYKTSEGIIQLQKNGEEIYKRKLEAEQELSDRQVENQIAKVTLEMVRNSAKNDALIPMQITASVVTSQIEAYNSAVMTKRRMEESAKSDNPTIQRIDEQIKTMRENLIATLEGIVNKGQNIIKEYQKVYDEAVSQVTNLPHQELAYRSKYREQTVHESMYLYLLQKQEEIAILMSNAKPKAAIIDKAYSLNEDRNMSSKMLIAIFGMIGFLLPPVIMAIKNAFKKEEEKL